MEKRIEAYSLVEFCQQIQEAVQEGFKIDFKDNASIPTGTLGWYKCIMHKGSKTAALLKPPASTATQDGTNGVVASSVDVRLSPADKASFEADLDKIEEKFVEFDKQVNQAVAEPFVPSIVFEVKEPEKKPKGRPKASRV